MVGGGGGDEVRGWGRGGGEVGWVGGVRRVHACVCARMFVCGLRAGVCAGVD